MRMLFIQLLALLFVVSILDANATVDQKQIYKTCTKTYHYHRCDLLTAMAFVESRFNNRAFNPDELAFGLFQMQCHSKHSAARLSGLRYGCKQLFNYKVAIRFAIKFLEMLDPTDRLTDKELVAAWNADRVEYCNKFKEYSWGWCAPGELKNERHVSEVYRYLKYIRKNLLIDWLT